MKALILPNDSIEDYLKKGFNLDERYSYFNPREVFSEIHLLYHDEKTGSRREHKFNLYYRSGLPFFRELLMVIDGIRLVRKNQIDIIRAYNPHRAGLIGALIKFFTKKPLVVSLHNDYTKLWRVKQINFILRAILELSEKISLKVCDEAWCVSNYLVQYATKKGALKAVLTPNKVQLELFKKKFDVPALRKKFGLSCFTLLFVGRMDLQKNIFVLLEAVKRVKQSHSIRLILVGRGTLREKVLSEAPEDVISKESVDHDHELPEYFAASDAFVLPSLTEGFGVVLIEAQAALMPIIASDIPETKDIVNKDNSLLFDPRRAEELAERIIEVIENDSLRSRLRHLSSLSAEKFSWDILSRSEALRYQELILKK